MFAFNNPRKDFSIRPPKQAIANNAFYVIDSANIDFTYNTISKELIANLTKTGVIAGTYGSSTIVPVITLDVYGRITGVTTATIPQLLLQTNSVNNPTQTLLNLIAGTNMTITDDGLGNITFDATGGGGSVTAVTATSPIISSGGTAPDISTSMATNKLIGRGTAGTGVMEEITLGTNLSLSGTTLNATGGGGGVTSVTATSPITSSGGTTPDISTSMNTNKIIGRYDVGTGVMQEVSVGAGLSISGSSLIATGSASGGSSISYYLNGGTPASVLTYYQMSKTAVVGTNVDFPLAGNGLISQWLTDANDPNRLEIPAGNWNFEIYMSASSAGGTPAFYVELLKYDGSFTTIANSSAAPENITGGTSIDLYLTSLAIPQTTLLVTDRLALRVYIVNSVVGRTITMHTQDSHLCQVITNFAGGIVSINGVGANTQFLITGTDGTDFNIDSTSTPDTHKFNIPLASTASVTAGLLSNTDYATFKVGSCGVIFTAVSGVVTNGTTGYAQVPYNGTITGWTLVSTSASGSCTVTVFKDTFANYPPTSPTDNIFTVQPALASQIKNQNLAPTFLGSQATVTAGDWIGFTISGVALVSWVNLTLSITKT